MGYTRHHAIIVTAENKELITVAYKKAKSIFEYVPKITPMAMNGVSSFFIPPDGSKEGWEESDRGDIRRAHFIEWLDHSTSLKWAEVQYGDDKGESRIIRHSEEQKPSAE